jgi:hypothetical protein
MVEQRSRLQLLDELRRLDGVHTEATRRVGVAAEAALDQLFERYSYGELQIIADFLSADTERLNGRLGD